MPKTKAVSYDEVVADKIGFDWDEANIEHIARHNVMPEEAEQVLGHDPLELEPQFMDRST